MVLTRWYKGRGNARIAIVDGGDGIPGVLRADLGELQNRRDEELVRDAVAVDGLTTRRGRPGGLGLKTLRERAVENTGSLTVLSGTGRAVFGPGDQVRTKTMTTAYYGTAIEFDLHPVTP